MFEDIRSKVCPIKVAKEKHSHEAVQLIRLRSILRKS